MNAASADPSADPLDGLKIAVSVRKVGMVFAGATAVEDASFDLPAGSFLTILGPSGSGKTTLLRMIAGFLKPTSGEIFIGGNPIGARPPHKRSIGMVFQRLALFPHMSAAENVAFPLRMRRFDARTIPDRVERYLELVRLGGFGDRRVHELSGGQQQRVAIARALVFGPDLLLLDEPLAALDRKLREEMQLEFRRIQRELGVTTINVTHDQREALVMSDEIVVMDKGRIQQIGDPAATYREPANPFVAGFVGITNFLPGVISAVEGEIVRVSVGGTNIAGRVQRNAAGLAVGQAAAAALRAEQIRILPAGADGAGYDNMLAGIVMDVIFEGERIVYEVEAQGIGGRSPMRVFDHDPTHLAQHGIGATVMVAWNARDLIVYPHKTRETQQ